MTYSWAADRAPLLSLTSTDNSAAPAYTVGDPEAARFDLRPPMRPVTFQSFGGTPGDDHLKGTSEDDSFDVSQGGNDSVIGHGGDDYVFFGSAFTAADSVDGGGNRAPNESNGDTVEIARDYAHRVTFTATTLQNVETLYLDGASQNEGGGSYSIALDDGNIAAGGYMQVFLLQSTTATDHIYLDASAETDGDLLVYTVGLGNDRIIGGGANDLIYGGDGGNDLLDGGGGWNRANFSRAAAGVTVSLALQGAAQNVGGGRMVTLKHFQGLSGSSHDDVLTGDNHANYLFASSGNDQVFGGKGDDLIAATNSNVNAYASTADGGGGSDTVEFFSAQPRATAFSLALQGTAQDIGLGDTLTATGFENIEGSTLGDALTGDSHGNILYGDSGDDRLDGGAGNDTLYGDRAYERLVTDAANVGSSGLGSFLRGEGADTLQGGKGDDLLDGGQGNDTADYSDAASAVHVSLAVSAAQKIGGGLGNDTLTDIENLRGSDFNDSLTGDTGANTLTGGLGGDTLNGGGGGDVLYGDAPAAITAVSFEGLSTAQDGTPGNGDSEAAVLSADGTKIAFFTSANNLGVASGGGTQIVVKDLVTGEVSLASHTPEGDAGDGFSFDPQFSPHGTKVAFLSYANDLTADDDNFFGDIFVSDLVTGDVTRVSAGGSDDPDAFNNGEPVFTADSENVIFYTDGDGFTGPDVAFALVEVNLSTGDFSIVSTNADGDPANGDVFTPAIAPDGSHLLFASSATNLVDDDTNDSRDLFLKDLVTGDVVRVSTAADGSQSDGDSRSSGSFSADGTKLVFWSDADNLVAGDTNGVADVFVKNLMTGEITLASQGAHGTLGDADSDSAVLSPDGRFVAFASAADNLVAGDNNGTVDIFVKDTVTGVILRVAESVQPSAIDAPCQFTADGTQLIVATNATGLPDSNGRTQIYAVTLDFPSGDGGNDTLNGGTGSDVLIGGAGADTLNGGIGTDTLQYGETSDSTSTGYDTVIGFNADEDRFDFANAIAGIDATVASGTLSDATFDANLAARANAAHLHAGHAVLFTPDAGDHAGETFLVADQNGTAGYQAGEDLVIRLDGAVNLANLDAGDFI